MSEAWTQEALDRATEKINSGKKGQKKAQIRKEKRPKKKGIADKVRLFLPRGQHYPATKPSEIIAIDPSLANNGIARRGFTEWAGRGYTYLDTINTYRLAMLLTEIKQQYESAPAGEWPLVLIEDALQRRGGKYGDPAADDAYQKINQGRRITKAEHSSYRSALMGSGYAKSASSTVKQMCDELSLPHAMLPPRSTKYSLLKDIKNPQAQDTMVKGAIRTIIGRELSGTETYRSLTHHVYDAVQIASQYHPAGWKLFFKQLVDKYLMD